jgi:ribosome assembly protein 1
LWTLVGYFNRYKFRTDSYSLRDTADEKEHTTDDLHQARSFSDKISYAFQLATAQGPLCNEPVQGIAVFLEEVIIAPSVDDESLTRDNLGRLTGEVIKTVQQAIKQGFLDWSPRLLLAMYSCEIQASSTHSPFLRNLNAS